MALELQTLGPRRDEPPGRRRCSRPSGSGIAFITSRDSSPAVSGSAWRSPAALVHEPQIILADEPTAALDKQSGRDVVNLLRKFAKKTRDDDPDRHARQPHSRRRRPDREHGRRARSSPTSSSAKSSAICEFLRRVPLFSGLMPNTLTEVADKMDARRVFRPATSSFAKAIPATSSISSAAARPT